MVFLTVPPLQRTAPYKPETPRRSFKAVRVSFAYVGDSTGDYVKERTCSIVSIIEMVSSKGIIGLSSIPSSMHRATSAAS